MATLSERKKTILRAIVESYIDNGEPVGSKYLIAREGLQYSSATVRNEMAELEEMGFIEQLHTSSGRVPSEKGYRFYVDCLMHDYSMTNEELKILNNIAKSKATELDNILERAASVMSSLTNYPALTIRKGRSENVITSFKIVRLTISSFLLIMVSSSDNIITKHIYVEQSVDDDGLAKLEHALNMLFAGTELDGITLPTMIKLQNYMFGYDYLVPPVMKAIYDSQSEKQTGNMHFEGVNRLLSYPELRDMDRLSGLLGLFDRKSDIIDVVAKSPKAQVNVIIGGENDMDMLKHTTFVFRTISSNNKVIGAIGIIGPCRMDYSKVVATVNYLSGSLSKLLTPDEKDKDNQQ